MGDMADLLRDNCSVHWTEDDYSYRQPKYVTCKNCGTEELHWVDFRGKWFLFCKDSSRHVCKQPKQDAAEAFKGFI
jgi:hypothetical protein